MLRIVRAKVVADVEMAVVHPLHLGVLKPAWALMPEDTGVSAATGLRHPNFGIVSTEKARGIDENRFLPIGGPNRSSSCRRIVARESKAKNHRRDQYNEGYSPSPPITREETLTHFVFIFGAQSKREMMQG